MSSQRSERVLSERELNRALLARQLLLERSRLPLARAIDRVGGLQTQYAPSAYVALWSRLIGFERAALTRALEQRRVVQGTLMRVTIHMVSAREYPLFAAGVRSSRQDWWLRIQKGAISRKEMDRVAPRVREHLAGGPIRAPRLAELLAEDGYPPFVSSGVGLWVDLLRIPPSGTWERRRADLYGLADKWIGGRKAAEADGLKHLVQRYLGGFGPASAADIRRWAGVQKEKALEAITRLKLRRFRSEDGEELFDLPRAPLPPPDAPAPVRLIPTWEAMLLVHCRRTGVLPERFRPAIFSAQNPQSMNTFLVDGRVAGGWRYEEGRISLDPFEPLARRVRRELDEEAGLLASWWAT